MNKTGFNKHDIARNACQLYGLQAHQGYDWWWHQRSTSGRMITDVTCEKKDMLLVNYESPDGAKRHNRLWNGGNGIGTIQLFDRHGTLVDRIHAENIGCEYEAYDTGQEA